MRIYAVEAWCTGTDGIGAWAEVDTACTFECGCDMADWIEASGTVGRVVCDGEVVYMAGDAATDAAQRKPVVELSGTDGNVYCVIAAVRKVLRDAGRPDDAQEFVKHAFAAKSYDQVLALAFAYCEVA